MNEKTPCTIQTAQGNFLEFSDIADIWLDGVELHGDRWGKIRILVRQQKGCLCMEIPANMRVRSKKRKLDKTATDTYRLFHVLWLKAENTPDYNKSEWRTLEAILFKKGAFSNGKG